MVELVVTNGFPLTRDVLTLKETEDGPARTTTYTTILNWIPVLSEIVVVTGDVVVNPLIEAVLTREVEPLWYAPIPASAPGVIVGLKVGVMDLVTKFELDFVLPASIVAPPDCFVVVDAVIVLVNEP